MNVPTYNKLLGLIAFSCFSCDDERLSRRKRTTENSVEPACETRHLYISPKAALSDKNQWKYIVNVQERDPRIRQIVRAEICRYYNVKQ